MGTRSLTVFQDEGEEIVVLYRQYDGYPTGHGQELKDFLTDFVVTNGIQMKETRRTANGMGCLAAQAIAHFKQEVGGFYLYPAGSRDCGEEYVYTVYTGVPMQDTKGWDEEKTLNLKVEEVYGGKVLFDGPVFCFDPEKAENGEQMVLTHDSTKLLK